jgi:hypothetical protein
MPTEFEELRLTVTLSDAATAGIEGINVKMKALSGDLANEQEKLTGIMKSFKEQMGAVLEGDIGKFLGMTAEMTNSARTMGTALGGSLLALGGVTGLATLAVMPLKGFAQSMVNLNQLSRELGHSAAGIKAIQEAFALQGMSNEQATSALQALQSSMVQVLDDHSPMIQGLRNGSKATVETALAMEKYIARLRAKAISSDEVGFFNEQTKAMQQMPEFLKNAGFTSQQAAEFTTLFVKAQGYGPEIKRKWDEVKAPSADTIAYLKIVSDQTDLFIASWNRVASARSRIFDAILALPFGPDSSLVKAAVWLANSLERTADKSEEIIQKIYSPQMKALQEANPGAPGWKSIIPWDARNIAREKAAVDYLNKPWGPQDQQQGGTAQKFGGGVQSSQDYNLDVMEAVAGSVKINPSAWEDWLENAPMSENIEDRRFYDPTQPGGVPAGGVAQGIGGQANEQSRRELIKELSLLNRLLAPISLPEGSVVGTGDVLGGGGGFTPGGGGGFGGRGATGSWGGGGGGGGGGYASARRTGGGRGSGGGGVRGTGSGTSSRRTGGGGGRDRPSGTQPEGGKGAVSKADVRTMLEKHVEEAGLVGFVPKDGAQYGITTGSKEEWVHFFTELAGKESGYKPGRESDNYKDPGGSAGLLQVSPLDNKRHGLGLDAGNTWEELHDPNTGLRVGVHLAKKWIRENGTIGNMRKSWSPMREGWRPAPPGSKGVQPEGSGPRYTPGAAPGTVGAPEGVRDISTTAGAKLARDGVMVPEGLLVHHTNSRGTAEDLVAGLRGRKTNDKLGLSVQFAIERDGSIVMLMPDGSIARHAGDLEKSTMIAGRKLGNMNLEGVEVIALNEDDVTEKQKESIGRLYRMRQARWGWKGPENSLYGHGELTGRKEDIEGRTAKEYREGKRVLPPQLTPQTAGTPAAGQPGGGVDTSRLGPEAGSANRPDYYGGTITVGGQTFNYGTGGGKRGSTPYGTYEIFLTKEYGGKSYSSIGSIASVGTQGGEINDPRYPGAPRAGIQIHSASHDRLDALYTAGCFGIAKSQWPRFKEALLKEAAKGPLFITINRNGQAAIGGKQILPGDGKAIQAAEQAGAPAVGGTTSAQSEKQLNDDLVELGKKGLNPKPAWDAYNAREAARKSGTAPPPATTAAAAAPPPAPEKKAPPPVGSADRKYLDQMQAFEDKKAKANVNLNVKVTAPADTEVKSSASGDVHEKTTERVKDLESQTNS